jgi:uncharacterized protein
LGLIIIFLTWAANVTTASRVLQKANNTLATTSYIKDIDKWRAERLQEINGENGWTTLVGLYWLRQGRNRLGSGLSNEIALPRHGARAFVGSIWLDKEDARLDAKPGSGLTINGKPVRKLALQSDADGEPTVLKLGSLTMFVIKRGDKIGLRVKDKHHPARSNFHGLNYFPVAVNWRVQAKFEAYAPPKIIPIVNVLGMIDEMTSPGALVFELDGKTFRLDPVLEKGSKQLFLIFADTTNGKQTYGAGRYLYVEPPGTDGNVVVDFNKAYNPPCAFTKFATCPLPPRQNRLAMRVEAGEMKYAGSGH